MRILITGDSHTGPLQRGLQLLTRDRPERLRGHELHVRPLGGGHLLPFPFFRERAGHLEITQPEYRRNIVRLPLPDLAADWIGMSGPLHTARVFRHPDWTLHALPDEPAEAGAPVSWSLLGRLVEDDQRHVKDFLLSIREQGMRPFVIEGPRPFRHHPAVATTGAAKIARIDAFYRDRMRRWLAAAHIPVVAIPEALLDTDGFMDDALRNRLDDHHHGNADFGMRMIEQTIALLETQPAVCTAPRRAALAAAGDEAAARVPHWKAKALPAHANVPAPGAGKGPGKGLGAGKGLGKGQGKGPGKGPGKAWGPGKGKGKLLPAPSVDEDAPESQSHAEATSKDRPAAEDRASTAHPAATPPADRGRS
jgi:hypothetical protein